MMVVGNGMIARHFTAYQDDEQYIIFASGISNSNNRNKEEFKRERKLLEKTIQENLEKKLIYFSTCGIYDMSMQSSPYVQHKLSMEEVIKKNCSHFCIFRVTNPVGQTNNPNTVLNYFIQHIKTANLFEVWKDASRNLIDLDDMYKLCHHLIQHANSDNAVINIANPVSYSVIDIVAAIEEHFKVRGNYTVINKQSNPLVDVKEITYLFALLEIKFEADYLKKMLGKYFPIS